LRPGRSFDWHTANLSTLIGTLPAQKALDSWDGNQTTAISLIISLTLDPELPLCLLRRHALHCMYGGHLMLSWGDRIEIGRGKKNLQCGLSDKARTPNLFKIYFGRDK